MRSDLKHMEVGATLEVVRMFPDKTSTLTVWCRRVSPVKWTITLEFHSSVPGLPNPIIAGGVLQAGQSPLIYGVLRLIEVSPQFFFSPSVRTDIGGETTHSGQQYTVISEFIATE